MVTSPAPDRALGLFETLLIFNGEPVELDAHLDRIAASLATIFGADLPPRLAEDVRGRAQGMALGRMRVTVDPRGTAATLATENVDAADLFPAWERAAALQSLPCDGGLGPHKWADRRPLGRAEERTVPLLIDRGEEVLEAGRASVFVARSGTLFTPAADGRILPGIARAGAIAAAHDAGIAVAEGPLAKADLLDADEVFLTGSVRGVEPARSLDGLPLASAGGLSRRVGEKLRQRWLAAPIAAAAPAPAAAPQPGPPVR